MSYFKLIHFELSRVWKIYLGLIAIVAIGQLSAVWLSANEFVNNIKNIAQERGISLTAALKESLSLGDQFFETIHGPLFFYPVMISITVLLIYMVLIWYRDWLGKNVVIHRLLLLPTTRASIYFAKLSTILLLVFGLLALQITILFMSDPIFHAIVPEALYQPIFLTYFTSDIYAVLLPPEIIAFSAYYVLGLTFVTIVFNIILFERSFRLKGFLLGGVLAVVFFVLHIAPYVLANHFLPFYLYQSESVLIHVVVTIVTLTFYTSLNLYLLKRKVTV